MREVYGGNLNLVIPWLSLTTLEHLRKHHPNFPVSIATEITKKRCHLMPPPHGILWSNTYYQKAIMGKGVTYHLYSAIMDNRVHTDLRPCVRILAHTTVKNPPKPWCYFWFNATGPPAVSRVARIDYINVKPNTGDSQKVFFLSCRVPRGDAHRKPKAVSVVAKLCESAKTLLEVVGAMERNETTAYVNGKPPADKGKLQGWNAAACGTALFYYHDDFSIRLVEWIEILRAMGFARVFLHETDVHPNITKVLSHYEDEGFVQVTKYSYPEPYVNEPSTRRLWYLLEKPKVYLMGAMYYTDCLVRHMHEYRFIGHLDPDEIPMLLRHDSYPSWMDDVFTRAHKKTKAEGKAAPSAYSLEWKFHPGDLPPSEKNRDLPGYLWALRHSFVPTKFVPGLTNQKCLYDMDFVTGVMSHKPTVCGSGKCRGAVYKVPTSAGYLAHFKNRCGKHCGQPGSTKEVPALLKYRQSVEDAVSRTLQKLQLI
ncbi:uncharacterized protein LOC135205592 [Macrobrachium nipponense]|uniref:uncharacterized protein LOC135205592 n=1 Tax=Macrobrachium nipponense TaxID=159736 RepID=UPI0030C8658B